MIIDVSKHNGKIDWQKAKKAGVKGAIIRCGYGDDIKSQDDQYFKANMDGAIAEGIEVGVYIYSYAKTEVQAKSEAAHVLRLVEPYKNKLALPIYYDVEEKGTEKLAKDCAIIFGEIIEKAGYWCGVYSSEYWWNNYLKGLDRFTKWVAKYGSNNGHAQTKPNVNGCDIWQYTSVGHIEGIRGNVDLNISYRDIAKEIRGTKKKSVDEIAREVIRGAWGNGAERKRKLAAAGYDYAAIQNKVNQMMGK